MIEHPISPIYDETSKLLILGSFPSVKSRENHFFYGHPQNRFWKVVAAVFQQEVPESIEEKKEFLYRNHIAVWDVIKSCDITGSSDSSIKNVTANDIGKLLEEAPIRRIFVNGKKAESLYQKYIFPITGRTATVLPSTSPANAVWNLQRLIQAWEQIREV